MDKKRYWQIRIFYSIYIGYVVYYLTRSSFKIVNIDLIDKKSQGIILASSTFAYAVSKFLSGFLTDIGNPKLLISLGLMLCGILNILMSFSTSFTLFLIIWTLNGFFQGFGWPPIAKMLTTWYPKEKRGSWWGLWSTSHNLGEFLIPLLGAISLYYSNWKLNLLIPGVIAIATSFFLFNRVRMPSTKEEYEVENESLDEGIVKGNTLDKLRRVKKAVLSAELFKKIFQNRVFWSLVLASFFVHYVRGAISPWLAYFFMNLGYSEIASLSFLSAFELGGLFGSFTVGFLSDRLFKSRRSIITITCCFGIALFSSSLLIQNGYFLEYVKVSLLGFCVYGPQMLVGVAIAENTSKETVSTSTGFAGLWSYLGFTMAHLIVPRLNWNGYIYSLLIASVLSIIFFYPLIKLDYMGEKNENNI